VRGGGATSSVAQDKRDAALRADTEKRRATVSQMQRLSKASPDEARLYTHKMGTSDNNASVVLEVRDRAGLSLEFMTCELNHSYTLSGDDELVLTLVCPRCCLTRGRPMGESQISLHSSNRPFDLDQRRPEEGGKAGEIWVNPEDSREVVHLAGTINMHRPARCPVCAWEFIIENSVLRGV
jgi:hypothetical protein